VEESASKKNSGAHVDEEMSGYRAGQCGKIIILGVNCEEPPQAALVPRSCIDER
jgi:hypothetical protein